MFAPPQVTPWHGLIGQLARQNPAIPGSPWQQVCAGEQPGRHTGTGVLRQVWLFGMHMRCDSQQKVAAEHRAVAQNEVPLSTVPASPLLGHTPRGTHAVRPSAVQHSWLGAQVMPLQVPAPASGTPVGQKRGSRQVIKPIALQQICVPVHTRPPQVAPASAGGGEQVPMGAQNSRPAAVQHSWLPLHIMPPHEAPASTGAGQLPRGTHPVRPNALQHSCVAVQVIPPQVPPLPASPPVPMHGTVLGRQTMPTGVLQQFWSAPQTAEPHMAGPASMGAGPPSVDDAPHTVPIGMQLDEASQHSVPGPQNARAQNEPPPASMPGIAPSIPPSWGLR